MKDSYTIFLVDDDFIFLEMLKETLVDNPKYSIVTFQSGEECINHLHFKPDIIVLDYNLNSENPNAKNGLQILQEISRQLPETRVIILSGQEDGDLVYQFIRENATDYVVKDEDAFDNVRESIEEIIFEVEQGIAE